MLILLLPLTEALLMLGPVSRIFLLAVFALMNSVTFFTWVFRLILAFSFLFKIIKNHKEHPGAGKGPGRTLLLIVPADVRVSPNTLLPG